MGSAKEQRAPLGHSGVITEKHFSLSHSAFWHQLLPMCEQFVREINAEAPRFSDPLSSTVPADARGLVNETGFRLFAAARKHATPPRSVSEEIFEKCEGAAMNHVATMRQFNRVRPRSLDPVARRETVLIAERLTSFFAQTGIENLTIFPRFSGCGWIEECHGDALGESILFEVKAGDRPFRSSDLRQVLCYCALSFASKDMDISDLCLVNPRLGRYVGITLQEACLRTAGRSASSVLADITAYVSDPPSRYTTG
jgi:hypothetical protein